MTKPRLSFPTRPVTARSWREELGRGTLTAEVTLHFDVDADVLFDVVTGETMFSWLPLVRGVEYADSVRGIGTVRDFLIGPFRAEEEFLHWVDGRHVVYAVTTSPAPLLNCLIESYRVDSAGSGRSRLTWTLSVTPVGLAWLSLPWLSGPLALLLERILRPTHHRGLARLVNERNQIGATS